MVLTSSQRQLLMEAVALLQKNLPQFDGSTDFHDFKRGVDASIDLCKSLFEEVDLDQAHLAMVLRSKLHGAARDMLDGAITTDPNLATKYKEIMEFLQSQFGDDDRVLKAVERFLKLQQHQLPVVQFTATVGTEMGVRSCTPVC
jgi:hypothetical protein